MSAFNTAWFYKHTGTDPKVIFDVGSCCGEDAARFKKRWPDALVVAFEPDPGNFEETQKRCEPLGVECVHGAVTTTTGTCYFNRANTKFRGSGSVLQPSDAMLNKHDGLEYTQRVQVPSIRLELFCAYHSAKPITEIDILHVDVEGAEFLVLKGLANIRPKMIFIEVAGRENFHGAMPEGAFDLYMEDLGYKLLEKLEYDNLYLWNGTNEK